MHRGHNYKYRPKQKGKAMSMLPYEGYDYLRPHSVLPLIARKFQPKMRDVKRKKHKHP